MPSGYSLRCQKVLRIIQIYHDGCLQYFWNSRSAPKIVEMLLQVVQLDSKTNSGLTALDIAVNDGLCDCARLLIQQGCDVNIQVSSNN